MSATVYALYRYTFPDGHAKEWALGERADGHLEVRWGHAGRLVQQEQYPAARRTDLAHRVATKVRKGYVAADKNRPVDAPIGLISVDALFSPIKKVSY